MANFRSYFPVLLYHNVLDSITRKYNIKIRCSLCSPQNSEFFFYIILYSAQLEKVVFTYLQGLIHKWKESCRRTWNIHSVWLSQYASQIYIKKKYSSRINL